MLKAEQDRFGGEARTLSHRLDGVDAHLQQWQEILATAARFATDGASTYTRADHPTRRLLSAAVIRRLEHHRRPDRLNRVAPALRH